MRIKNFFFNKKFFTNFFFANCINFSKELVIISNYTSVNFSSRYINKFFFFYRFFLSIDFAYIIDSFGTKTVNNILNTFYVCNAFLTDSGIVLKKTVKNKNSSESISNIWSSNIWAEREASEFNKLEFTCLGDSRRLLTDYFYTKEYPETHKVNFLYYNYYFNDILI